MKPVFVLLVDDEAPFLEAVRDYLSLTTDEFVLDYALSGEEALEKAQKNRYDVIVSDFSMPEMNGIELLKKIRAFSTIPFILFTGTGDKEVVMSAINSDADFYLEKGDDPDILFPKLTQMIRFGIYQKQVEEKA